MRTVAWNDVKYNNNVTAFVDLRSINQLFEESHFETITAADPLQSDQFRRMAAARGLDDPRMVRRVILQSNESLISSSIPALKLLERIIVTDALVVDAVALEGSRGQFATEAQNIARTSTDDWLFSCAVPREVYEVVHETVLASRRTLRTVPDELVRRVLPTESADYWWSMQEKFYHDELSASSSSTEFAFADSGDSFERACFYLEIATAAECPVVLSSGKDEYLKVLSGVYRAVFDAHSEVTKATAGFRDILRDGLYIDTELPIPSLAEYIVLTAVDNRQSLLEATLHVRASAHARAYRAWLSERQRELRVGWASKRERELALAKLNEVVERWKQTYDSREGIQYKKRSLNVDSVPTVGWLAKLAGLKTPEFRDPVLDAPRYLQFISRWFDHV